MTNPNGREVLGSLPARLDELAHCPEEQFNPDEAANAIEEAVGGSLMSDDHRAAALDFRAEDLAALGVVVRRLEANPFEMKDNNDLELYADLIENAHFTIDAYRKKIEQEKDLGGPEARINWEMSRQQKLQRKLFLQGAGNNTLNAEADLRALTKKKKIA